MRPVFRMFAYLCLTTALAGPALTDPALAQAPSGTSAAATPAPLTPEQRQQEMRAAWQAAMQVSTTGPADVTLIDQARLHLPADMKFIPPEQAQRLLRAWGNSPRENPIGMVVGTAPGDDWAAIVRFVKEGYIKDDDARDWNADDLLKNLREGTEESNEDRRARGFPELEIVGWIARPAYDAATHRLVWSISQKKKGAPDSAAAGVNYNTFALGRDGYFTLDMLTDIKHVDHDRVAAANLLAGLDFDAGKRYQDFNASTDHVAEYGLAALVGVVALKKLGILALGAAFLLKFAKIGAIAVAGVGALVARLFRRKPAGTAP